MPELPEVETIARGVDARLRNDRIDRTWFSEKKEPFKSPPGIMADALRRKRIERVFRVGKHVVFDLAPVPASSTRTRAGGVGQAGLQWVVHLGMTGRLMVASAETPVPAHTHGILYLASGRQLRFVDPRRFGRMSLHIPADAPEKRGFVGTGREPLSIAADEFRALFRGRRTSIKAALLNQRLLQGVGNIYADESLFRAGIRPRRMASRLTRPELARLQQALLDVLHEAIALGGSSVSDYVDADGEEGFFQNEHKVYLRTNQPCLVCGRPIRRTVVGGRGTHYCPQCQK